MFNEGLKFKKNDWGMVGNKGDCYLKMKEFQKALEEYKIALELGGNNTNIKLRFGLAHYYQALNFFNQKKYQECINKIEDALKWDKNNADYMTLKGLCHSLMADSKGAYLSFKSAVEKNPDHKEATTYLNYIFQASPKAKPTNATTLGHSYTSATLYRSTGNLKGFRQTIL